MINKLTEALFWETWPKVAKLATVVGSDAYPTIRILELDDCSCPLAATARYLLIPGRYTNRDMLSIIDGVEHSKYPKWAKDVIRAADGFDVGPESILVRERLIEAMRAQ